MFTGWPKHTPGELSIFLLGPGIGESMLLVLPDGAVILIDCFQLGAAVPPLNLLTHLGLTQIDLLVVTHPDQDHVGGLTGLLDSAIDVKSAWTYPHLNLLRDLVAAWGGSAPSLQALDRAWERLDALADVNRRFDISLNSRPWVSPSGRFTLTPVAPIPSDLVDAQRQISGLLTRDAKGQVQVDQKLADRLQGKQLGDHPNLLSIALAAAGDGARLLLSGDVEAPQKPNRGWSGILKVLGDQSRLDLLTDVHLVKVAHHGSIGAWHEPTWSRLTQSGPVDVALITPFSRSKLPDDEVLHHLSGRAWKIGISGASGKRSQKSAPMSGLFARRDASGAWTLEGFGAAKVVDGAPLSRSPSH
jgi:beta-lactamase superfamily II metal-dependent hydrolase